MHKNRFEDYKFHKADVQKKRKLSKAGVERTAEEGPAIKKFKQTTYHEAASELSARRCIISQEEADNLIMDYIAEEMRPLATVEKPAFCRLLRGFNPNVSIMCRKTPNKRLNSKLSKMHEKVGDKLKKASFVCTTADIWSFNRKSYLGMSAHFIEMPLNKSSSVSQASVSLACRRFYDSHVYDTIAAMISQIHCQYNALSVPKFKKQEIESLQEYFMVMKPVAATLDTLQGDNVYYGHVFPHLHSLKLEAFQNCQLKYAKLFAATMLAQMKTRFEKKLRFDVSNSCRIVAAVSHPLFKLWWVPTNKRAICIEIF